MDQPLNADLQRQLMDLFIVEAQEHLQVINQNMLAMEALQSAEMDLNSLEDTMRAAHSLKGAARAVKLERVESLAHQLETLFVKLQAGEINLSRELFDLVYKTLDVTGELIQSAIEGKQSRPSVDPTKLVKALEKLHSKPSAAENSPSTPNKSLKAPKNKRAIPKRAPQADNEEVMLSELPEDSAEIRPSEPITATDAGSEQDSFDHEMPLYNSTPAIGNSASQRNETVRVSTLKLDALLSQIGELQVTRIGSEQRTVELHSLQTEMGVWETEWRKNRGIFQRLAAAVERSEFGLDPEEDTFEARRNRQNDIRSVLQFMQSNAQYLSRMRSDLDALSRAIIEDQRHMSLAAADLEDEIRQTRMLPFNTILKSFPRMVRDLAMAVGKEVTLLTPGDDTEVDRSVLEQIKDPLVHLLRNCIDHGIETPEVRLGAGKTSMGTIQLKAAQRGESLVIEIFDDGAGIDLEAVRNAAVRKRMLTEETASALNEREVLWLIFRSGLSTNPIITDLSGRGIGLDVVRQQVERLHGLLDVSSQPGQGTRFTLTLPLTVATTLCIVVQAGRHKSGESLQPHLFGIPIMNVIRLMRLDLQDIGLADGHQIIRLDGAPVMLVRMTDVLGLEAEPQISKQEKRPCIVIGAAEKRKAFLVDAILGAQELVIKSLPPPLIRVKHTSGAAILSSGQVTLILNAPDLLVSSENVKPGLLSETAVSAARRTQKAVIMVVDDSITTRTMEKNILEAVGYQVQVAADGLDAWTQLQNDHCDLVLTDVMMPHMDGFELTSKLRADARFSSLPIILLTSLESPGSREVFMPAQMLISSSTPSTRKTYSTP